LRIKGLNPVDNLLQPVKAPDHAAAGNILINWIEEHYRHEDLAAVGHRVVHGGPKYSQPQRITLEMLADLRA